jgi:hypothetical protein
MGTAAASPPARGPARRSVDSKRPTAAADNTAWAKLVVGMAIRGEERERVARVGNARCDERVTVRAGRVGVMKMP